MNRSLSLGFLLAVALWSTGCLEFERQTVYYNHDASNDILYIYQDYQGIYGSENPLDISSEEITQLTSVMKGERTFFFGNWITEYNRENLEEALRTPQGELEDKPEFEKALRALAKSALANIKVENVGFYFNQEKQLCGTQRVTIRNVSKLVPALNKVMLFLARSEGEKEDKSLEEQRLLIQFAEAGQKAMQFKGNQVTLRWPVPESEYLRFKDRTPQGAAFKKSGGSMDYKDGMVVLTMGQPDSKMVAWSMPVFDGPYVDNAVTEAKKYGIKESFDAEKEARNFLLPGKKD